MNKKSFVLLNYNFKGGVGKTTLTGMEGYLLNQEHKKTLLIDFDPQANLTDMISKTYHKEFNPIMNLTDALKSGNISESICRASKYLDIVPTDWSLTQWSMRVDRVAIPNKFMILRYMINKIRNNYDYIFIDVPPTFAPYSLNAIFAADDIAIVLETQEAAYKSALKTVSTLGMLKENYNIPFHFLGVILYLKINAKVDREVAEASKKTFTHYLYNNVVKRRERVKGFSKNGITEKDGWDYQSIGMYQQILNETLKKIGRNNK